MKTKILTMLAVAAGSAAICAQSIYSLNVVGYINIDVPANQFKLIANQLNAVSTPNTLSTLIPNPPSGTKVFKYNGVGYDSATYIAALSRWSDTNMTLNPGEGAFITAPSAFTITLVGEVMQGALTNQIPAGFSIRSPMVPESGALVELVPNNGDKVFRWNGTGYVSSTYISALSSWNPAINVSVGESFFYSTTTGKSWIRNFSAN